MALKELLAADTIRRTHDRARPALDVRQQPVADLCEIIGEVALGDGVALAVVGPQRLVGVGTVMPITAVPPCLLWVARRAGILPLPLAIERGRIDARGAAYFARRLVLSQPLNAPAARCAAGPAGKSIGDEFWLQPMDVWSALRRFFAAERLCCRSCRSAGMMRLTVSVP